MKLTKVTGKWEVWQAVDFVSLVDYILKNLKDVIFKHGQ